MTAPLTGGCICGAVRYECTAESIMAFNCHCRDCQRATGGAYVPAVVVLRNALRVTGEVRYFGVRGESGQILNRASDENLRRHRLAQGDDRYSATNEGCRGKVCTGARRSKVALGNDEKSDPVSIVASVASAARGICFFKGGPWGCFQ